jgi:hypothetical protein
MGSHSVVISDEILKEGIYNFKLKCEAYVGGCMTIGLEFDEKKDVSNFW